MDRYVNAVVLDKDSIGIDPNVRESLKSYYLRSTNMNLDKGSSIVLETEDECIQEAIKRNYHYLILTWEGNLCLPLYNYHNVCINYIKLLGKDWLVAGHIMDQYKNRLLYKDANAPKWKDSFWLYPITAIINLDKWQELGCLQWGNMDGTQQVLQGIPSEACVHDNYTPKILNPGKDIVTINTRKGWNVIDCSLKNKLPVYNLSNEIRNSQAYLYPENDVVKFNKFWLSMFDLPKIDYTYEKAIYELIKTKFDTRAQAHRWIFYLENTEKYFPNANDGERFKVDCGVDTLALPSSGFKDFILTKSIFDSNKNYNIIYFDIIKQCIDIKISILNVWDGRKDTFEQCIIDIGKEYKKDDPLYYFHLNNQSIMEVYDNILKYFNNEDELEKCWNEFKSLDKKFIHTDLLENPWPFLKELKGKSLYICLSDIGGWKNNIISFGLKNICDQMINVLLEIEKRSKLCFVDYKNPKNDIQSFHSLREAVHYLEYNH